VSNYSCWLVQIIYDFQTLIVVIPTLAWYFWREKESKKLNKKILASALYAEIDSLQNQWIWGTQGGLKKIKNPEDTPFNYNKVNGNYFIMYDNSADKIGMFDKKLVQDLVYLYNDAKGFLDTVATWEEMIKKVETAQLQGKKFTLDDIGIIHNYYNKMVEQQDNVFYKANKVKAELQNVTGKLT
jgi:hypothetical protein